jgi:hypothetical protein
MALSPTGEGFQGKGTWRPKASPGEHEVSGEWQIFQCVHTWQQERKD